MTTIRILTPHSMASDGSSNVAKWYVKEGDYVKKGELVLRLDCGDHYAELEAECSGEISILINANEVVEVNSILGLIKCGI